MLDIGWTELLVIGLVLVVIVGPKDLPRVLRTIGQWTRRVKKIARDFQDNIEDIARDSEIEEMRNKFNDTVDLSDKNTDFVDSENSVKEIISPNITDDEVNEVTIEEKQHSNT